MSVALAHNSNKAEKDREDLEEAALQLIKTAVKQGYNIMNKSAVTVMISAVERKKISGPYRKEGRKHCIITLARDEVRSSIGEEEEGEARILLATAEPPPASAPNGAAGHEAEDDGENGAPAGKRKRRSTTSPQTHSATSSPTPSEDKGPTEEAEAEAEGSTEVKRPRWADLEETTTPETGSWRDTSKWIKIEPPSPESEESLIIVDEDYEEIGQTDGEEEPALEMPDEDEETRFAKRLLQDTRRRRRTRKHSWA